MFSLSNLNLYQKKNSKIVLSEFQKSVSFSILCLYESSTCSDTGNFVFIQQNSLDGHITMKKLIWISESVVYSFCISTGCDWLAISLRGGVICILPLGVLMGRVQKKCDYWKTNDVSYLSNKIQHDSPVTCMKWWTSSKNRNTCLIGKANGDFLIIDLANGSLLFTEEFTSRIQSIDLVFSSDGSFSYGIITSSELIQWKLLLEEVNNKEPIYDKETGFETLDLYWMHSSNIIESKHNKKSKADSVSSPTHVPTKFYQFTESIYLKSQCYNEKYFVGAYDRLTGKYKLFDCGNLDSSLYEFQLPLNVVDICVTEELLFIIVCSTNEPRLSETEIPTAFHERKPLKLCVICRQYAQNHLFEKYTTSTTIDRKRLPSIFKPSISDMVPNMLRKCILYEFDFENMYFPEDILGIVHFPFFVNFDDYDDYLKNAEATFAFKNPKWIEFFKHNRGKHAAVTGPNDNLKSKWLLEEVKQFTPIFLVARNGVSICHLRQCFEDKFIDCLLENDTKMAEWLGAGLRLDMNFLYQYTAQLLASGNAQLGPLVTKSKKSTILEFFVLGYTSVSVKLSCLTQFWPIEDCLQYSLSLLSQINSMSPVDRGVLSNSLIPMFGYVMSEPVDSVDGTTRKRNKYYDKFRRFVVSNCFFNDFKAAKLMFGFGQMEEAFFIAKEKGCVVDLFKFLMDNNYSSNWSVCFNDINLRDLYSRQDRDFILSSIGLMDLEIIARSDPKLIKCFGEFVCQCFMKSLDSPNTFFSFKTTTHLCTALNPYGSIIDSLFHIYSCTTNGNSIYERKDSDMSLLFEKNLSSSTESLTGAGDFSKNMKIRREIGPELLAFCLLVISRDNQINETHDFTYFIQLYGVINATVDSEGRNSKNKLDVSNLSQTKDSLSTDSFDERLLAQNFKPKKNLLSNYWLSHIRPQCLALRGDLCISISVFDLDLFDDDYPDDFQSFAKLLPKHNQDQSKRKSPLYIADRKSHQRCQINMLGFQKDKTSRVLLLPKSIENGKEIIRQIALGKQHVLILTDCGSVYGAGNNVYGQLGIEKSLINQTSINRKNYRLSVINPQPVNMRLSQSEFVVAIVAGDFHSGAIVVDTGKVDQRSQAVTWGWGVHGQLGHGNIDDQRFPKRLRLDDNESLEGTHFPIKMAMGCYHTVLLTNTGSVYSSGNNSYGQLGVPGIQKSLRPILVKSIVKEVTVIDTKYFHTVCCTASNDIFVWGLEPNLWQNQYNENRSHDSLSTPVAIDSKNLLSNEKVVQISCGTAHTTILTESKLVYTFGFNIWGQLGLGNRRECNHLVEVKVPKPIDFVSTDNGVTVAMHLGDKITKIMAWGRCSHSLIQDNIKGLSTDTVLPQLLVEFKHSVMSNFIDQNCFGIDALCNSGTTILNKHQLMIFFRNCSDYLDRNKLINILESLKEFDIIADFYLVNEMLIESLFWRLRSIVERLSRDNTKEECKIIREDVEIIFQFYIRIAEISKTPSWMKAVITMITGFFKKQGLPWEIFERICFPFIDKYASVLSMLLIKHSLVSDLTSGFIRDLLLNMSEDNHQNAIVEPPLGSIVLLGTDIQRFHELIKTGNSETIYDAADDHKVVFFAGCNHAAVVGRYREHQLKLFVDKLRKKQLNFSTQMIQRLYADSTSLPDCLDCLSQRL